jgi:UDP-3-O-[3-hydroxymyristoyl] glucosamine N-acyltransferase
MHLKPERSNHLSRRDLAQLVDAVEQTAINATAPEATTAALLRVSALDDATADAIVFAQDDVALERALHSSAGAILAKLGKLETTDPRLLWVRDPRFAFALAAQALAPEPEARLIHPSAIIHPTAKLGARTRVGAAAVIEADVVLGDDTHIAARATIHRGVQIGSRVVVQSGAVLGATGFGYARNPSTGEHVLFPQQGTLVIEDDVEIGANTTIDRGALGETRIGRGTKIDNLVHIGHNCRIGKNVVIAAQVGLSGSCTIDDGVTIAGQVGLGDHVHIGPGVILGGQSGVYPGKTVTGPGQIFAGTPAEPRTEYLRSLARIRRLK